jgi:hypothetical protein
MPTYKTYNDEKHTYSVDMMMTYVNTHKLPIQKIKIEENLWQIEQPVWGDYSPMDVLKHPEKKKYAENIQRIRDSDLSYPIFLTSKHQIIDGYHRFLKAIQTGQTTIKAYVFEPALMRKFIFDKKAEIHDLLGLYVRRFC